MIIFIDGANREATTDEENEIKTARSRLKVEASASDAAEAATAAAKTSAHTKLAALGLTADEIAAL